MNILDMKRRLLPMSGYYMGGGGSGGGPTQSTSYQTNIPEYAKPYVETMLGATQKQLFQGTPTEGGGFDITGFQPYKAYGGTYDDQGNQTSYDPSKGIAGFQPMQTSAQQGIAGMQVPGEYGQAAGATQQSMQNLQNANYQGGNFGNQFRSPGQYQPGQFSMSEAQAPDLQNFQMDPAERVRTQSFNQPGSAEAYMSPYMQNVVDIQKREAQRQSGIQGTQQQAQATQAGAFGGGRDAIMRAERERNLGQQMGDIQATGQQAAFQNAQQQFNAEQQARMQAQQANQQAGLTVGGQNLGAKLGVQQLGAGQNMQAQLANQQMFQQAQQAQEQSRQFGAGQGMTAAQQRAQYGLAGQQLGEQSRQYGAGYGLQANQAALGAANQLASIGGQRLQAQQGIYGLQNQYGAQQQAMEQQIKNQAMQDYANAQQYPLMQLGTMSNMLRGLPMQAQTTQQYVAQPNMLTQAIGAAGTGASLYNAFNTTQTKTAAKGGIMSYDVGGKVESDLESMDEEGLQKQLKESSSPSVKRMAQRILRERQMSKAPSLAGGGIIAFAEPTDENNQSLVTEKKPPIFYRDVYETFDPTLEGRVDSNKGRLRPIGRSPLFDALRDGQFYESNKAKFTPKPEQAAQGIVQPAPTPKVEDTLSNLPPFYKSMYEKADATSKQSRQEIAAELKAEAGPNLGAQEQRAKMMSERVNTEDEARRNRYLRAAEFFASWGSTPGPTLVAGMSAVKANVANIISDEKEAKRIRMEIDKSIYALDEAARLEDKGFMDKAESIKEKQAANMMKVNEFLVRAQEDKVKIDAENKKQADLLIGQAKIQRDTDASRANTSKEVAEIEGRFRKEVANIQASFGIKEANVRAGAQVQGYEIQERGNNQRALATVLREESNALSDIDRIKRDPDVGMYMREIEMAKDPKNKVSPERVAMAKKILDEKLGDVPKRLEGIRAEKQRLQDLVGGGTSSNNVPTLPSGAILD